jgi:hypothetical protein
MPKNLQETWSGGLIMEQKIEFIIEGKKVIAEDEKNWSLNGILAEQVSFLNKELAISISSQIKKIIEDKEAQRKETLRKILNEFKTTVLSVSGIDIYSVTFTDESQIDKEDMWNIDRNIRSCSVSLKGDNIGIVSESRHIYKDFSISYDPDTYYPGDWYSHKSDRPWVKEYHYKKVRFSSVEKAVLSGIKDLSDATESIKYTIQSEQKRNSKVETINSELAFTSETSKHWVSSHGHSPDREETVISVTLKNGIEVHLDRSEDGLYRIERIKIEGYSHNKISSSQMNNILKTLSEIKKVN